MSTELTNIKSFLGLTKTSEVEDLLRKVKRDAKKEIADKLKTWHTKYDKEQQELEDSFSYDNIQKININFWDDFYDDDFVPEGKVTETFAAIEDNNIPDCECHRLLNNLLKHIKKNNLLPSNVKLRMYLSDSTAEYPSLISEHEYMLTKRWKINITNITHKQLDTLIETLKHYSYIVPFNIYSES